MEGTQTNKRQTHTTACVNTELQGEEELPAPLSKDKGEHWLTGLARKTTWTGLSDPVSDSKEHSSTDFRVFTRSLPMIAV